ncbi:Flp family type IVb pilin [Lacrimispora aerotolerans]|jgi:Flp pilus assembly pilin Flp|uniref:Flp family type IVb pilin n=1 Tax=Lacrimispora aerotolerans TaxID=36832 RepID=UPI000AE9C02B|nr:Flp family type IVb pilin [Lacrimispora aerotolerans]
MRKEKSESGQAMVEYALIFGTVVLIAAVSFGGIAGSAGKMYDMIKNILMPAFP